MVGCLVYHGTSDVFLPKILKEGFVLPKNENKYDEVRREFSKYVSPDVLTDAFFDKHIDRMPSGRDLGMTPGLRIRQTKRGLGIFYSARTTEPQRYAKSTMKNGGGEFERNVLGILENIPKNLLEAQEGERYALSVKDFPPEVMEEFRMRQEMYHILQDNIKPEFLNEQGQFQAPPVKPDQKAIVFEIEINDMQKDIDGRLDKSVPLSQIKRIGYANDDENTPVSFMSVEDFLKNNLKCQQNGEAFSYDVAQVLKDYWTTMAEQRFVSPPVHKETIALKNTREEIKNPIEPPLGGLHPEVMLSNKSTERPSGPPTIPSHETAMFVAPKLEKPVTSPIIPRSGEKNVTCDTPFSFLSFFKKRVTR